MMPDYVNGADWKRLEDLVKRLTKQSSIGGWEFDKPRRHRSEGLYILPGKDSFFLMQRMAGGTVECLGRMSLTDVEAEGLDIRIPS